jgi:hypothetical protein
MDHLAAESLKPPVTRRGIYWLASYPKSGNTWTRIFIGHLLGLIYNDPDAEDSRYVTAKYTLVEAARENFNPLLTETQRSEPLSATKVRTQAQQLLATRFVQSGFVKTHSAALTFNGMPQINLGVTRGAVYIVRNPLDIACSFASYFGTSINEAIRRMNMSTLAMKPDDSLVPEIVSSWSAHAASWTESPIKPFVMRYEDMLARPTEAFTALARHASIAATPAQIERAIELSDFSRLKKTEETEGFFPRGSLKGSAFFRAGKSEQWRDTLKPRQVERIVADHGKMMERFGYLP